MAARKPVRNRKYFTVAQANATLPLLRAIVRDITELARELHERDDRLMRVRPPAGGVIGEAYREEIQQMEAEAEHGQERMREYMRELDKLEVQLKDFHSGLVDFPCWMDDREVYLCWRLGEPEVAHWHEVDAGFAGRQKLMVNAGH